MAFCSLQTTEMYEDSVEYYITGLVITPLFLKYSSTFSLVPHISERRKLRGEGKPLRTSFTYSTCQTRTEMRQHLCVGKHVQNLGSVSLAFAFSSCFESSDCHSSVGTEMKSSTSACKMLQVSLDTVKTRLDGLGLEKCWSHKKKMHFLHIQ